MPCPCHAHAVPLPYRAAKGLECVFPIWFTQCGRVWFTLAMPCSWRAHSMLWPCRSSPDHGTARPSRDGLWATCPRSASSGYHAEFHEDCYQKHTNPQQRSVPTTVKSGSSTLHKRRSVKLLGYFRLPRGLSRRTRHCRSRAEERHGMCELTQGKAGEWHGKGMGATWARHSMCESAVIRPLKAADDG
jgi:hypothetical protein